MKANSCAKSIINPASRLLLSLAVLLGSAATIHGATRTWDGSYSPLWSDSQNWVGNVVPAPGDDLVFPAGASHLTNANDLGSDTYRSITISGSDYVLQGVLGDSKTIGLTHGIDSIAAYEFRNTVELNIDLAADQSFSSDDPFGPLYMVGNVDIGNHTLEILGDGMMSFTGVISGTGRLTKNSSSLTYLGGSSDNTFSGETVINSGVLKLSKPSGSAIKYGQLTIGDGVGINDTAIVRELYNFQIGNGPITINEDGWLDVDDYIDTVGAITFNGGHAGSSGTGILKLGGTITVNAATEEALLDGNVYMGSGIRTFDVGRGSSGVIGHDLRVNAILSGGGLRKTGAGDMMLNSVGVNIYTGTTTVEQGGFIAWVDSAFGDTGNGTVVGSSGSIYLVGVNVGTESLTLGRTDSGYVFQAHTTCSWAGPVTLAEDALIVTSGSMEFSGAISGSGGITLEGSGDCIFSGSSPNTYAGDTHVFGGTLSLDKEGIDGALPGPGDLYVGDGVSAADSIVVQWLRDLQINENVDINIIPSGKVDLNDHNDFVGNLNLTSAGIWIGSGLLGLSGDVTATAVINRVPFISGNLALMSGIRTFSVTNTAPYHGRLFIYSHVSGSGGILKTGTGELTLGVSNVFAGATTVAEGSLCISDDHALGDTAAGTVVQDGAHIRLANVQVIEEPLILHGDGIGYGALWHYGFGITNSWAGPITLASDSVIGLPQNSGDTMSLSGVISGPGSLTKKGAGTLMLTGVGNNSHGGNTIVEEGTLLMGKVDRMTPYVPYISVPHSLIVGGNDSGDPLAFARHINSTEIADDVIVNTSGFYALDGYYETIGDLSLYGGADVDSGAGRLTLSGDVNVDLLSVTNTSSIISGELALMSGTRTIHVTNTEAHTGSLRVYSLVSGSGGILKTGDGYLLLYGSNTFAGATTVAEGSLNIYGDHALGDTVAGTVVQDGAKIRLGGTIQVGEEPLTLYGDGIGQGVLVHWAEGFSNRWAGPITLASDVVIDVSHDPANVMDLSGIISGPGSLTKKGDGTLILSGSTANTYSGDTHLDSGTLVLDKSIYNASIPGNLYIGDGAGGADADVVRLGGIAQIGSNTRIAIADSGLFDMNNTTEGFGSLEGSGRVAMGSGTLITGSDGSSTTYSGLIEGSGMLRKYGAGTFSLTGNNTYSGTTEVNLGTLLVIGSQPSSDVYVAASGTLGGTGTVGAINSDGTVAPGTSAGSLGSGTVTMDSATFEVELDGFAFADYDRLNVIGKVLLANNPRLLVSLGYMPAVGDRFTIINNDDTDAVKGTFKGLPDGALLTVGNATLRIDYDWGLHLGNDVVLTVTGVTPLEPLQITSIGTAGGDVDLEWVGGVPFYVVEKKTTLTNGTWTAVSGPTRDLAASLPADTTNGFYRVQGGN